MYKELRMTVILTIVTLVLTAMMFVAVQQRGFVMDASGSAEQIAEVVIIKDLSGGKNGYDPALIDGEGHG